MISLKTKQRGFTIVELLIVIVVIGILAALVITTFSGVQRKARNTERETDIKVIHSQAEAYFAQHNSKYPSLADLQSDTWIQANMQGTDLNSMRPPNQASNSVVGSGGTVNNYVYTTTPGTCDSDDATATADCTDYNITANLEGGGTATKDGLN